MNTSTLYGCSTQKLHENSINLSFLCITWAKKKCPLFLFHSLTLSLCFSLFFRLHLSAEAFSFVLLAHSGTHTKMAETLCASAHHKAEWPLLLSFLFLQGRMAFASFFSFSSAYPTRLATLLIKRSQTSSCFGHYPRNGMLTLEASTLIEL